MIEQARDTAPYDVDVLDILAPLINPEPPERAAYLDTDAALRDSAVAYAAAGWPVLPLAAGGKLPVLPNIHPQDDPLRGVCRGECGRQGHGLHDASTDVDVVAEWWRTMPSCNIGIRTGDVFDVIDLDMPGGDLSWVAFKDDLVAAGRTPPEVLAVAVTAGEKGTPGWHLLIRPVPGSRNGTNIGGRTGLDYRARGGYVVAPPSRLRTVSRRYKWSLAPDHRLLGGTT